MGQVHATIRIRSIDEDTLRQVIDLLGVDANRISVDVFPTVELPTSQTPPRVNRISQRQATSRFADVDRLRSGR